MGDFPPTYCPSPSPRTYCPSPSHASHLTCPSPLHTTDWCGRYGCPTFPSHAPPPSIYSMDMPLPPPYIAWTCMTDWCGRYGCPTFPSHAPPPSIYSMDPYDRLVWEVWMPNLRRELVSWIPRTTSDKIISLLEDWRPLLPPWVMDNIVDQLVLPRLQSELESWDPTTDVIPIHQWIHPWLPIMGEWVGLGEWLISWVSG